MKRKPNKYTGWCIHCIHVGEDCLEALALDKDALTLIPSTCKTTWMATDEDRENEGLEASALCRLWRPKPEGGNKHGKVKQGRK